MNKFTHCCFLFFSPGAETEPKDAGTEKSSGVVRLNTIRQIIEQVQRVEEELKRKLRKLYSEPFIFLVVLSGPPRSPGCDPQSCGHPELHSVVSNRHLP